MALNQLSPIVQERQKTVLLQTYALVLEPVKSKLGRLVDLTERQNIIDCYGLKQSNLISLLPKMSLVKILNLLVLFLILAALYNLFFGIDSKRSFLALQNENQELLKKNNALSNANDLLETDILSAQKNDTHAEKFAREELNLIYKDEDFLRFKEVKPNELQE